MRLFFCNLLWPVLVLMVVLLSTVPGPTAGQQILEQTGKVKYEFIKMVLNDTVISPAVTLSKDSTFNYIHLGMQMPVNAIVYSVSCVMLCMHGMATDIWNQKYIYCLSD